MNTTIESLIERFRRMVARDGGELTVLAVGADTVRLRYRPGGAGPECADGVCVMPHRELEQLIGETLARQWPGIRVVVEAARETAPEAVVHEAVAPETVAYETVAHEVVAEVTR